MYFTIKSPPTEAPLLEGVGAFRTQKQKRKDKKMYGKRKKLTKKKSKRQFLEGAVKENKLNNKSVDRGGIRL